MKNNKLIRHVLIVGAITLILASCAKSTVSQGFDWPQWRGTNGNGVSLETGWDPKALEGGAKVLWTADVGPGYSNIAISSGRLYTTGSADFNHMVVACRDAATGTVIWQKTLEAYADYDDPMSTPSVDGDRVYVAGRNGQINCLRTADGSAMWQKTFGMFGKVDIRTASLGYGMAGSPVVDGALLLIDTNRSGVALEKMTGKLAWDSGLISGCKVYASPVAFDLDGKRAALFVGPKELTIVETATGKAIWSFAHSESAELVRDPIAEGNLVCFAAAGNYTVVDQSGSRVLWSNDSLRGGTATPVLVGGYLYGPRWNRDVESWDWHPAQREEWLFQCVDLKTGEAAWKTPLRYVSLMSAGGKLIMLDLNGILTIAEATPKAFTPISRADVLAGANRPRLFPTPPVLCDGRIYCRNYAGDLICIDVSK